MKSSKSELQDLGRRIREARRGVVDFLQQTPENHVYWIERTGKTAQNLTLHAAPIDISSVLNRMLFPEDRTCIVTSATLSVGQDDLAYFRNRIGAFEADALQIGSPFDFERQMRLYVVQKMPDPAGFRLRSCTRKMDRLTFSKRRMDAPLFSSRATKP